VARIAVDAMGGDRAPEEIVAGALEAASPQITPVLVGPAGLDTGGLELVEAQTTIAMD
jgi:fatty acid/phospholipid biosynthesis enzyme